MKTYRLSDHDVQWATKTATKGTLEHDAYTDLLRCRRALRRIMGLLSDVSRPGHAVEIEAWAIAAKALGKGEES